MADIIDRNKSYTNKDFQSLYTELLDLVPKLTSKWTPSESNEADPGVVLIKLMAVLGDKLNYNIDKQILECFPGTVTQRRNARQLYDLIGYPMKWYRSATLPISFRIKNETPKTDVIIPKFTPITDAKNQINYVTLQEVVLSVEGDSRYNLHTVEAMQGILNPLTVNGSEKIRIVDLDENYRIYFNGTHIAENGIFISDYGADDLGWTQVDNIDAYPLGSKVYQFKVSDDESNAYIQFPIDINVLVGSSDAVSIKYLTTAGASGNISPNILENFGESKEDKGVKDLDGNPQEENVTIIQSSGSINGSDPESIDDAYRNSRLIIGTFNTLITRKDYENYIRRLMNNNRPLVSNCVIADRTNDINLTRKLLALDGFTERYYVRATKSEYDSEGHYQGNPEALTAYDIVLYALEPSTDYETAFTPIITEEFRFAIEQAVEQTKAVNQDYHMPTGMNDDVHYLFRNMYKLKGQVVTTDKLTKIEAEKLEEKINLALQQKYSAYNVEFGSSVDYTELIEYIQSIDPRIKTVALDNPSYQVQKAYYKVTKSGDQAVGDMAYETLTDSDKQDLVARMIAGGNVQLFEFNNYFNKDFGQNNITIRNSSNTPYGNEDITSISTASNITLDSTNGSDLKPYSLRKNEVIQLFTPYYKTITQYSTGCKAEYITNGTVNIPANVDYKLADNEQIKLSYVNSENKPVVEYITDKAVINCTKALEPKKEITLANGSTLSVKRQSTSKINKGTPYIIILNKNATLDNDIKKFDLDPHQSIILESDEYLIYTNPGATELIMLGSGTEIVNDSDNKIYEDTSNISFDDIDADNISAIDWNYLPQNLIANEMEIITINEGCTIGIKDIQNVKLSSLTAGKFAIDNNPIYLTKDGTASGEALTVTILDTTGTFQKSTNEGGDPYRIKSRLNITYVNDPMPLYANQSITFTAKDITNSFTVNGSDTNVVYLQFSKPVLLSGSGEAMPILDDKLKIYAYTLLGQNNITRGKDGILQVKYTDSQTVTLPFIFANIINSTPESGSDFDSEGKGTLYLIPILVSTTAGSIKIKTKNGSNASSNVLDMLYYSNPSSASGSYDAGAYVLFVRPGYHDIVIDFGTNASSSMSVQFSNIFVVDGINLKEINVTQPEENSQELRPTDVPDASRFDTFDLKFIKKKAEEKTVFERINEINTWIDSTKRFNYTHIVEDTNKVIQPTLSSNYWNLNHTFNQYTIPCIDLKQYNIKVNPFSIR